MKSGFLTTEFWLTLIGTIGTLWSTVHGFIPATLGTQIALCAGIVYVLTRTILKAVAIIAAHTVNTKDDAIVAGLQAILDKLAAQFGEPKESVEPKQ